MVGEVKVTVASFTQTTLVAGTPPMVMPMVDVWGPKCSPLRVTWVPPLVVTRVPPFTDDTLGLANDILAGRAWDAW